MVKHIKINSQIAVEHFGSQQQFKMFVDQNTVEVLCLALFLFKEELIDVLELQFSNYKFFFKICKGHHCIFDSIKENVFKGQISNNTLDYISHYLLKFYRDRVADSQHIDIDFENAGELYTLTIYCSAYKEYSGEEMKKILA